MAEPIGVSDFVKVLSSKELKTLVESSKPTFIVTTRTKCCSILIPVDISTSADTFLSGGGIAAKGMHCNKSTTNIVKICELCDVVLESTDKNPKCEVCGKNQFKDFTEDDVYEWEVTNENVLGGCIHLERAGSFEPNHKNSSLRTLRPGAVTWNGPISLKTSDKVPEFGIISKVPLIKKNSASILKTPSFLESKLKAILEEEEQARNKAIEETEALAALSSKGKKQKKAREIKIDKGFKNSGFAAVDYYAKELEAMLKFDLVDEPVSYWKNNY